VDEIKYQIKEIKMKKGLLVVCMLLCMISLVFANGSSENTGKNGVIEMKLGHIQPAAHPNGMGADEFARLVNEKSGGRIKVSVFPACQLGTEAELFDSVALGSIDFAVLGYGDAAKQCPSFKLLDAPYLASGREAWVELLNSDAIAELQSELVDKAGVRVMSNFYYGARWMTTSNLEVRKPADLSGHTIRVPDQEMYVATLNAMGATATPMAFSEVFLALQQKVIDGQENPLATISMNSFNEAQKYLIKTEHIIGGNCFYVNEKKLKSLPEDLQQIVLDCAKEAAVYTSKLAFEAEDNCKKDLVDKGMIVIEDVDKDAFIQSTRKVLDSLKGVVDPVLFDKIVNAK
jgi:tripartite ATP-independent periplasmic transporter solute receptor, DctP family